MILQQPPTDYDANYEIERNRNIESEDLLNRKKQQDIEIAGDENLILSSPNGTRFKITVSNTGTLTTTAI